MKISKKRLRHIVETLDSNEAGDLANTIMEEWYPEVFREKMDGWYRDTREEFSKVLVFFEDDKPLYGFNVGGKYYHPGTGIMGVEHRKFLVKASDGVVEYHLCVEAKKRGFKGRVHINNAALGFNFNGIHNDGDILRFFGDYLDIGSNRLAIFHKGIWAEVIETISKEEAEKQLGKKIV